MGDREKVPLQDWFTKNLEQDPDLYYLAGMKRQVMFVRDVVAPIVSRDREKRAFVISEHRSKSVVLPVYLLESDYGARFYLRNNFYDWKLSVDSTEPVLADFAGLFMTTPPPEPDYTGDPIHPVYFEGFPKELVFGYYEPSDKRRWSAEIASDERLWTALFLIMRGLGGIKAGEWSRRAK